LAKGVRAEQIEIVRDGTDIPRQGHHWRQLDPEVIGQIREGFRFVLLHAGNIGFYGAWDTLVAAARQLAADGVGLVFVGEGTARATGSSATGVSNIRFRPFPRQQNPIGTGCTRRALNHCKARPGRRGCA
jgi:hypothetical protein